MRWVYSFLIIVFPLALLAQKLVKVEVYSEAWQGQSSWQLKADLHFTDIVPGDSIRLFFRGGPLQRIYLRQGRAKDTLSFKVSDENYAFRVPAAYLPGSTFSIDYQIAVDGLSRGPFLSKSAGSLLINALNSFEEESFGPGALVFPILDDQALMLEFFLALPPGFEYQFPGETTFIINGSNFRHYFLQSEKPINPRRFFLLFGKGELAIAPDQKEALLESYQEFQESRQIESFRASHQSFLSFLTKKSGKLFLESDFKTLITPPELNEFQGFFLLQYPPKQGLPQETLELRQRLAAALAAAQGDTARASQWFTAYYRQRFSEEWFDGILRHHYQQENWGRSLWEAYLQRFLREYRLTLSDTMLVDSANNGFSALQSAQLSLAKAAFASQRPLSVEIKYRYSLGDSALFIIAEQLNVLQPFQLSLKAGAVNPKDSVQGQLFFNLQPADTAYLQLLGAPLSADVQVAEWAPLQIINRRPENYLLYELSRAADPSRKEAALEQLLQTNNLNLLATVMGLAIQTGKESLIMLALDNAGRLRERQKKRLIPSLEELTKEHSSPAVRASASRWLKLLQQP